MKYFRYSLCLLQILVCVSCTQKKTSKNFNANDHIVDVQNRVLPIEIEEPILSGFATPYIVDKYLIMTDIKTQDNILHIFDKNTFEYIKSVGLQGVGPGEITNLVGIVTNKDKKNFYVIDYGKEGLLEYNIDSLLTSSDYIPRNKKIINKRQVPLGMQMVNDSIGYALFTQFQKDSDYKPVAAKMNIETGEISFLSHKGHPDIKRKRANIAISSEHNLCVEAYWHHDLLSFSTLDGKLLNYVYGSRWNTKTSNRGLYFENILFYKDKLIAAYYGGERFGNNKSNKPTNDPDKILIFDSKGNHLNTLKISHPIINYCCDTENGRLIFSFDDEIQFGYLDINEWI